MNQLLMMAHASLQVNKRESENVHLGLFDLVMFSSLILELGSSPTVILAYLVTLAVGLLVTDLNLFSRRRVLLATPILFVICFFVGCWVSVVVDPFLTTLSESQVFV